MDGLHVQHQPAVVIDNGTEHIKCGVSGMRTPISFASCVGYPRFPAPEFKQHYVGEEVQLSIKFKRSLLSIKFPLWHGYIENFDDMEKIWNHVFENELGVSVDASAEEVKGVVLTEKSHNPARERERTIQTMFEVFNLRRCYLANQATLALYAAGRTTGVVLDAGASTTHAVPIYEGSSMPHTIQKINLGGRELSDYCQRLNMSLVKQVGMYRDFSERVQKEVCHVSLDFTNELEHFAGKEKQIELPDGSAVTVHTPIISVPELLFKPSMDSKSIPGVHQLLNSAVHACDQDLIPELLQNTIVTGGSTCFPNFRARFEAELQKMNHFRCHVTSFTDLLVPRAQAKHAFDMSALSPASPARVLCPQIREEIVDWLPEKDVTWRARRSPSGVSAVWIGGAILCEMSIFEKMWINQFGENGYEEIGPRIVNYMCNS